MSEGSVTRTLRFIPRGLMGYHYEKPVIFKSIYGDVYSCNHPIYDRCTLCKIGSKGLAVIQQRFDESTKSTGKQYSTDVIFNSRPLHTPL